MASSKEPFKLYYSLKLVQFGGVPPLVEVRRQFKDDQDTVNIHIDYNNPWKFSVRFNRKYRHSAFVWIKTTYSKGVLFEGTILKNSKSPIPVCNADYDESLSLPPYYKGYREGNQFIDWVKGILK